MTEQLLEALITGSEIRPRPPHPISSFGSYIGPLNPGDPRPLHLIDHCWQAKGSIRERFATIRREISDHLQSYPGTSARQCRVVISLYMIGRTPQTAAPTVLLISKDADYRRDAKKAIKQSDIMSNHPGFSAAYVSKDPGFSKLKKLASEQEDTVPTGAVATDVFYDPLKPIRALGATVYIRHNTSLRTATANAVRIGDAILLQTVYHAFVSDKNGSESQDESEDDTFEIDSDWGEESQEVDETDIDLTSIGSQSPDNGSDSDSSDSESSRSSTFSKDCALVFDSDESSPTDQNHQDAYSNLMPSLMDRKAFAPKEQPQPRVDSLLPLGRLAHWSADDDWALIEITAPEVERIHETDSSVCSPVGALPFDSIASQVTEDAAVIVHTTSGGSLAGTLSGTLSSMRLPGYAGFKEVYTVNLQGPLANGDCGSLVIDANTKQLYGYIVAGCETTGSAYVFAAYQLAPKLARLSLAALERKSKRQVQEHEVPTISTSTETNSSEMNPTTSNYQRTTNWLTSYLITRRVDHTIIGPLPGASTWANSLHIIITIITMSASMNIHSSMLGGHWTTPRISLDPRSIAILLLLQFCISFAAGRGGRRSSSILSVAKIIIIVSLVILGFGKSSFISLRHRVMDLRIIFTLLIDCQVGLNLHEMICHVTGSISEETTPNSVKMNEITIREKTPKDIPPRYRKHGPPKISSRRSKDFPHMEDSMKSESDRLPISFWITMTWAALGIVLRVTSPPVLIKFNDDGEVHWPNVSTLVTEHLPIVMGAVSIRQQREQRAMNTGISLAMIVTMTLIGMALCDHKRYPSQESAIRVLEWVPLLIVLCFPRSMWRVRRLTPFWVNSVAMFELIRSMGGYAIKSSIAPIYASKGRARDHFYQKMPYVYCVVILPFLVLLADFRTLYSWILANAYVSRRVLEDTTRIWSRPRTYVLDYVLDQNTRYWSRPRIITLSFTGTVGFGLLTQYITPDKYRCAISTMSQRWQDRKLGLNIFYMLMVYGRMLADPVDTIYLIYSNAPNQLAKHLLLPVTSVITCLWILGLRGFIGVLLAYTITAGVISVVNRCITGLYTPRPITDALLCTGSRDTTIYLAVMIASSQLGSFSNITAFLDWFPTLIPWLVPFIAFLLAVPFRRKSRFAKEYHLQPQPEEFPIRRSSFSLLSLLYEGSYTLPGCADYCGRPLLRSVLLEDYREPMRSSKHRLFAACMAFDTSCGPKELETIMMDCYKPKPESSRLHQGNLLFGNFLGFLTCQLMIAVIWIGRNLISSDANEQQTSVTVEPLDDIVGTQVVLRLMLKTAVLSVVMSIIISLIWIAMSLKPTSRIRPNVGSAFVRWFYNFHGPLLLGMCATYFMIPTDYQRKGMAVNNSLKSMCTMFGIESDLSCLALTVLLPLGVLHSLVVAPIFRMLRKIPYNDAQSAIGISSLLSSLFLSFAFNGHIEGPDLIVSRFHIGVSARLSSWRLDLLALSWSFVPIWAGLTVASETPRWLVKRGRYIEALKLLTWRQETKLKGCQELIQMYVELEREKVDGTVYISTLDKWLAIWANQKSRASVTTGLWVMLCQQLVGINVLAFMTSHIWYQLLAPDPQAQFSFRVVRFSTWTAFILLGLQFRRLLKFVRVWLDLDYALNFSFYGRPLARALVSVLSKCIPLLPVLSVLIGWKNLVWRPQHAASLDLCQGNSCTGDRIRNSDRGSDRSSESEEYVTLALLFIFWADVYPVLKVAADQLRKKVLKLWDVVMALDWDEGV